MKDMMTTVLITERPDSNYQCEYSDMYVVRMVHKDEKGHVGFMIVDDYKEVPVERENKIAAESLILGLIVGFASCVLLLHILTL